MDDKTLKGLVFLLLMSAVAIRYFIKTGKNDTSLNWIDYAIGLGVVVMVIGINT